MKAPSAPSLQNERLPGPLTIYVAWHPDCPDGEYLANQIYTWFRKPSTAVERSGAGIPVYYRSQYLDRTPHIKELRADDVASDLHRLCPIQFDHAEINVVIPLVDEHMVNDKHWRHWLYEIGRRHEESSPSPAPLDSGSAGDTDRSEAELDPAKSGQVLLIPIQLHSSISRLAPLISGINAVRVDRWDDETDKGNEKRDPDGGDQQGAREKNDDEKDPDERRRLRRGRRARRYLVQTLVRELRQRRFNQKSDLLPRSVFLSHAKGDQKSGVGVAERIRIEALNHGQIDTFFDATQLDWATGWKGPMMSAAGERTAAFIAIFGDQYASRYWCREEIRSARRPRLISPAAKPDTSFAELPPTERIWWVQPTVILDTLDGGWTRLLPEMSGTPIIRWQEQGSSSVAEVLDRVMLEALRSEIQARHALLLADRAADRYANAETPNQTPRLVHFLTWVPDPYTLMELAYPQRQPMEDRSAGKRQSNSMENAIVVYPGHGLAQGDELRLQHYWGEDIEFLSVEELALELHHPGDSTTAKSTPDWVDLNDRPMVALSVGDPAIEELHALGYGPEHLDDAVYRLATALIGSWARLAYGGLLLRTATTGFLESLLDAAGMAAHRKPISKRTKDAVAEPQTVLHSFQAWDFYEKTKTDTRANLHGLCTFHDVNADGLPDLEARQGLDKSQSAPWRSRSLTAMRKKIAETSELMVTLGGKTHGWLGFAPGVIEEVCRMHQEGRPVLVFSAFGGASRELVAWLLNDDQSFKLLDLEQNLKHDRNAPFQTLYDALAEEEGSPDEGSPDEGSPDEARRGLEQLYGELQRTLTDFRTTIRKAMSSTSPDYAGLTGEELKLLMRTSSVSRIRHLLADRVVPYLFQRRMKKQAKLR